MALETSHSVAGHRVLELLGEDADWTAFAAEAPDGRPVTLRVFNRRDRGFAERLGSRVASLAAIAHPSIAPLAGHGDSADGLWIATEATDGPSLRRLIDGGLPPLRALRLLGEVADGLDAAHRGGLVHGRLTADQVLVQPRPSERARLTGFDLMYDGKPEDDVRALASLLQECLGADPPPAVARVAAGGLTRPPGAAAELIDDAARALLTTGAPAPPPIAVGEPPRRSRRPLLLALGSVLLIAAAGAGGYLLGDNDEPSPVRSELQRVSAGELSLAVPPGFTPGGRAPERPRLENPAVLTSGDGTTIAAGLAADPKARLDPTRLRPGGGARTARLGALRALRLGGSPVVFVAPTSRGTVALVCSGRSVERACGLAAATVDLQGALGYNPIAGLRWRNGVARTAASLRRRRASALERLRRARTPGAQQGAARLVATAHARAAAAIRRRRAPAQARAVRRRLLRALLATDRAYRALARAGGAADQAAFSRARARVRRAEGGLRAALRSL